MSLKHRLFAASFVLAASAAHGSDVVHHLPIADVMAGGAGAQSMDGIRFYFGDTPAPAGTSLGESITNKKTNAFNKTEYECHAGGALKADFLKAST